MSVWTNWARTEVARPERVAAPRSVADLVAEVAHARDRGTAVKMAGTGHSFTGISAPVHTLLRPEHFGGIVSLDRDASTVTVRSGTRLDLLNAQLERLGLSLTNMGDIAEQTLAGATSTGTHGTGGTVSSLSAQVVAFTIVTGRGEVVSASPTTSPELFAAGRVGLGALGILTELTMKVEPLFALEAHEQPLSWQRALATYDELVARHDHVDLYWFPDTEHALAKVNDRRTDLDALRPLGRWRSWLDDEFLSNTVFGLLSTTGTRLPAAVPVINRLCGRTLSERRYSDVAHRVFTSTRRVRFKEMEYAVPRAVGLDALREVRRVMETSRWRVGFPIEVRSTAADDIALSTSSGRDSLYLAFHVPVGADHTDYFAGVEAVMKHFDGRPHWGKMHTLTAADLASLYPRFEEFLAVRDEVDPDRIFTNPYLRRVLGD